MKLNKSICVFVIAITALLLCSCGEPQKRDVEKAASNPKKEVLSKEIILISPNQQTIKNDFRKSTHQFLMKRDFAKLNEISKSVVGEEARFKDGTMKVTYFFMGLSEPAGDANDEGWALVKAHLEDWLSNGGGINASVALADFYVNYGWRARGDDYANAVSKRGWDEFYARLKIASGILSGIENDLSECPYGYRVWQYIALGENWNDTRYAALLEKAIKIWPDYEGFYLTACYRLLPRWHGEEGEWEAFLGTIKMLTGNAELGDIMYARSIWYLIDRKIYGKDRRIFQESDASWSSVKKGYELLLEEYPESMHLLSEFCVLAGEANDPQTAYQLFTDLNGHCDLSVWGSSNNFEIYRDWAISRSSH